MGAFVLPPDWMGDAGPLGAIIGLSLGGALMMLIGVSYGYLAHRFPVSGGAFAYTLVGFGRTHAFICAWFMNLGYVSIVALNASALALLARRVVPGLAEQVHLYTIAGWDVYLGEVLISILGLAVFAALNIRGTSMSGRTQFVACVIMIGAVLVLAVGVLLSPQGELSNVAPVWHPEVAPVAGILAIMAIAPWAYIGFDNVPPGRRGVRFSGSTVLAPDLLVLGRRDSHPLRHDPCHRQRTAVAGLCNLPGSLGHC